jgi:hypothetical protein
MIDYEKLKLATDLNHKAGERFVIQLNIYPNDLEFYTLIDTLGSHKKIGYKNLDELIEKLQEITKPKAKYKIGQLIWCVDDDYSPHSFVIESIDFDNNEQQVSYGEPNVTGCYWLESELFPTREALIEHQIQYWLNQRDYKIEFYPDLNDAQNNQPQVDVDKCKHESDGLFLLSNPLTFKCRKCGVICE